VVAVAGTLAHKEHAAVLAFHAHTGGVELDIDAPVHVELDAQIVVKLEAHIVRVGATCM
jgi:hypothetical protein